MALRLSGHRVDLCGEHLAQQGRPRQIQDFLQAACQAQGRLGDGHLAQQMQFLPVGAPLVLSAAWQGTPM